MNPYEQRNKWESKGVSRGRTAAWEQADLLARQCVVGWNQSHPYAVEAQSLADKIKADNDAYQHELSIVVSEDGTEESK